ncbi:MAG: TlyA family RNA methyltransferase [Clostridia bacterium]|nr:TlyA family RNA methyltransferase [Clostridia bacterium]
MNNRLDIEMVNRGLIESREKAKALIMSGIVYVNNQKAMKAGDKIKDGDQIEIRGQKLPFVSRGGLKLDKAVKVFDLSLKDKVCMDIGASTGGFTDCMLQNDAKKVYAVDVGYGQLAWKLRSDDRVVNMERTNIRYIDFDLITDEIDFISIDVAFISLKLVLPVAFKLLKQTGELVALIKPQFEAGKEEVGKKGVVRDISIHRKVINEILEFSLETGFSVLNLEYSPIKGPEGNIEFLLYLKKDSDVATNIFESDVMGITEKSHTLGG